MNKETHKAGQ